MDNARICLGRIRCLLSSIGCMKKGEPLASALCFVPNEITYQYEGMASIPIYDKPDAMSPKIGELTENRTNVKFACSDLPHFSVSGRCTQYICCFNKRISHTKEALRLLPMRKNTFNG